MVLDKRVFVNPGTETLNARDMCFVNCSVSKNSDGRLRMESWYLRLHSNPRYKHVFDNLQYIPVYALVITTSHNTQIN